jgi:glycosyltransferase involved in cell wall biosynthesis
VPNLARLNQVAPQPIRKEVGVLKLVSVGRIAPEKGTLNGLNALAAQNGHIQLDLYGTCYNEGYWNECLQVIAQLPSNIKVNYHGPCPSEDVANHLISAHALLLPSEGENYGHAIVESLGQGRPVLISKHTPWQDLAAQKAGWDVTNTDLPRAIAELAAMDQARYDEWCRGAAGYYEKQILVPFVANKSKYLQLFEK